MKPQPNPDTIEAWTARHWAQPYEGEWMFDNPMAPDLMDGYLGWVWSSAPDDLCFRKMGATLFEVAEGSWLLHVTGPQGNEPPLEFGLSHTSMPEGHPMTWWIGRANAILDRLKAAEPNLFHHYQYQQPDIHIDPDGIQRWQYDDLERVWVHRLSYQLRKEPKGWRLMSEHGEDLGVLAFEFKEALGLADVVIMERP